MQHAPETPLRTIRKAHGLSLAEVAEKSGVAKSTLSRLERGLHRPRADTLAKIAKALGLSELDDLLKPWTPGAEE
jgi:transcriptional regulator with XRE-family HTH domain